MSDNWRFLSWEYVCDQAPLVQQAHDNASFHAEYGVNFYEFINTQDRGALDGMVQAWWDSLAPERRRELIAEKIVATRSLLDLLEAAVE